MATDISAHKAITEAISRLNDIAAAIAIHQRRGGPNPEKLLDMIKDEAGEIRELLEAITDKDG